MFWARKQSEAEMRFSCCLEGSLLSALFCRMVACQFQRLVSACTRVWLFELKKSMWISRTEMWFYISRNVAFGLSRGSSKKVSTANFVLPNSLPAVEVISVDFR
jgi:hypothetical protein